MTNIIDSTIPILPPPYEHLHRSIIIYTNNVFSFRQQSIFFSNSVIISHQQRYHVIVVIALQAAAKSTQFITNKRCPFAQKAWIALESSDTAYEMKEIGLYGAGGKPGWFWKLNPSGTVPVVVVSDTTSKEESVFADSELILEAVDDGRIPSGKDAMIQMTCELSEEEKQNVDKWRRMISNQLIPVGKSAVLGGSVTKLRTLLKELDDCVIGSYLTGDKMTTADAAAFPFFWRLDKEYGIEEKNLRAWLDTCMKTESIKRTIPSQGWWWWWW